MKLDAHLLENSWPDKKWISGKAVRELTDGHWYVLLVCTSFKNSYEISNHLLN